MITREEIAEYNEEALFCDGFDEAIIGYADARSPSQGLESF